MFSFNTFSGVMKMYLAAVRRSGGQVEVTSRMLRPGEDGLGGLHIVIKYIHLSYVLTLYRQ